MAGSAPTTTPTAPTRAPDIIGPVLHGFAQALTNPTVAVIAGLVAFGLAVRMLRFFRWISLTSAPRDQMRRYAGVERATVMRRAGGRCEFHGLFGGRCRATEKLQADHIHPWSRGGTTTIRNGQALCARHNKDKAARIPFEWEMRRLAKRRVGYFPAGQPVEVVRREVYRSHAARPAA